MGSDEGGEGGSGGGGIVSKQKTAISNDTKVEKSAMTAQQATRIIYRLNHVMANMGLGENFDAAVAKFQQLVFMARMLQMSLNFLSLSTPYGWIMGGLGLASVAVVLPDLGQ